MTLSTPTRMTRITTTHANCTSEHGSALVVVFLVLMLSHESSWLKFIESVIFTPCCTCAVLFDLFDLPFYFNLSLPSSPSPLS